MSEKILFFDTETTGLDPATDSIHQIAGIIYVDGQEKRRFDFRMQPKGLADFPDDYVTPVGGITKATLLTYKPFDVVYRQDLIPMLSRFVDCYDKTDKFHLAGYNCQAFDTKFLRAWFERCGDQFYGSWFWPATIDVMCLAANDLRRERHKMPNFKLQTVAEHYGFDPTSCQYHEAMTDILATKYIWDMIEYS